MFVDQYPFSYHTSDVLLNYFQKNKGTDYKKTFQEIIKYEGLRTLDFIYLNIVNLLYIKNTCIRDDIGNYFTELHFGLSDDIRFNAQATKFEGNDLILINLGLTFRLYEFFKVLLMAGLFSEVGNLSSKEHLNNNEVSTLAIALLGGKDSAGNEYPEGDIGYFITDLAPKCQIRREYAKLLYILAIQFLFCHEVAHHRRSHFLIAQNNRYSISDIFEIENRDNLRGDKQYRRLLQALEFDADGYGLALIIRQSRNDLSAAFNDYSDDQILTMKARSIVIMLRTLDNLYPKITNSENSTHPLPMLRATPAYVFSALRRFLPTRKTNSLQCRFIRIYQKEYEDISSTWFGPGARQEILSDNNELAKQVDCLKREASRLFSKNRTTGIYWEHK